MPSDRVRRREHQARSRLAVIGDIGGHLRVLRSQLRALGVDFEGARIPADLIVCQVGDLVHKGPDSPAVVAEVDRLLRLNPGRWVQLVGNHEVQYVIGREPFFQPEVDPATAATIRSRWRDGMLRVAACFRTVPGGTGDHADENPGGDVLITHAGLTAGAWGMLGRPTSADECTDLLNTPGNDVAWREGGISTGLDDRCAGPIWARAAREVYPSWLEEDGRTRPSFNQAHGHSTPYSWRRDRWRRPIRKLLKTGRAEGIADPARKITRVSIGPELFFGTDPDSEVAPASVDVPLVLDLGSR